MKTVHITTIDFGGAYRAAYNINRAMSDLGVDSKAILRERQSEDDGSVALLDGGVSLFASRTKNFLNLLISKREIINDSFGTDISGCEYVRDADIVFVHWANSFISYKGLARLCALGKPVFLVLHDEWYFTGGCHLDYGCERFRTGCGKCPILRSSRENDLSNRIYIKKEKVWGNVPFSLIAPSNYMAKKAGISALMRARNISVIHNPVDTDIFCVKDKQNDKDVFSIGFAALKPEENWKGADLLWRALRYVEKCKYRALIAGNPDSVREEDIPIECEKMGMLDSLEMPEFYRLTDVCVIPSRQENLSNFVLEAMACGKPVVAFDIGGMSDMISHKMNGYLARPFDPVDMARGIEYCAAHSRELGSAARDKIERSFSLKIIGNQYVKLCSDVIGS